MRNEPVDFVDNDLLQVLKKYQPWNEQEEKDKEEIIRRLKSGEELYSRSNTSAHITSSAWVVSPDRKKVLMAHHNIYDSWAWLGGHADGNKNLLAVAIKEVKEESGLKNVNPILNDIFSLEIVPVYGHVKHGKYVSSHLHLNVTYLLEANPEEPVHNKPDENMDVKWFPIECSAAASKEPWIRENVYSKLNEKLRKMAI